MSNIPKNYPVPDYNDYYYESGIKSAHEAYGEFVKKEKDKDLYCYCEEPELVKAGFNRMVYDYCRCCKKERLEK